LLSSNNEPGQIWTARRFGRAVQLPGMFGFASMRDFRQASRAVFAAAQLERTSFISGSWMTGLSWQSHADICVVRPSNEPDTKTFIGLIEKALDFPGYYFSPGALRPLTNHNSELHCEYIFRLYEQLVSASVRAKHTGEYTKRWLARGCTVGWERRVFNVVGYVDRGLRPHAAVSRSYVSVATTI